MFIWAYIFVLYGCTQDADVDCGQQPYQKECQYTEDLHDNDLSFFVQEQEMRPCFTVSENGKSTDMYCTKQSSKMYLCVEDPNTKLSSRRKCISTEDWLSHWRSGNQPVVVLESSEYASLRYIGQATINRD